jgi:hypothetical protein
MANFHLFSDMVNDAIRKCIRLKFGEYQKQFIENRTLSMGSVTITADAAVWEVGSQSLHPARQPLPSSGFERDVGCFIMANQQELK